jgi:hydroxypyruvate reductase
MLKENPDDPVLFLLSGGASSLLVQPRAPVTLNEKAAVTGLLLRSGADIQGINTVRKHLSGVKGGGLLRHIGPRPVLAFLLSDVIGDDPSVIGSGPTAADPTTFADAEAVLCDNSVISAVPPAVVSILREGQAGRVVETIKPGAPELARVENVVIGSNRTALDGAAEAARDLGYRVVVETEPLAGDTRKGARSWFERVRRQLAAEPKDSRVCIIAGGETTVEVVGNGKGGRNQEFALTLVEPLAGGEIAVLSAGTDGVDGPTEAAGAFADGDTAARADAKGLPVSDFLSRNDSYSFFAALRDLLVCGPTGTNLMDIKIALRPGN